MISDDFGYWLAGLIDGEGCFHIKRVGGAGGSLICTMIVGLRVDDRPILEEVRQATGIGALYEARRPSCTLLRWEVTRKAECVELISILDRYPLRTRKARDYALWREAVNTWQLVVARRRADWTRMAELKVELEHGRRPLAR